MLGGRRKKGRKKEKSYTINDEFKNPHRTDKKPISSHHNTDTVNGKRITRATHLVTPVHEDRPFLRTPPSPPSLFTCRFSPLPTSDPMESIHHQGLFVLHYQTWAANKDNGCHRTSLPGVSTCLWQATFSFYGKKKPHAGTGHRLFNVCLSPGISVHIPVTVPWENQEHWSSHVAGLLFPNNMCQLKLAVTEHVAGLLFPNSMCQLKLPVTEHCSWALFPITCAS